MATKKVTVSAGRGAADGLGARRSWVCAERFGFRAAGGGRAGRRITHGRAGLAEEPFANGALSEGVMFWADGILGHSSATTA